MKKYIYIFFLLATTSLPCLAQTPQNTMLLVYSDFRFNLPSEPISAIGSKGKSDNFLVLRYGNETEKKYLSFSILSDDLRIDFGCELSVFYKDAFSGNLQSDCKESGLEAFNKVFMEGKEVGVWNGSGYGVYYSISNEKGILFVVNPAGIVVQIDSDFLKKRGLKNIVSEYID